jgi:hypothetical protein
MTAALSPARALLAASASILATGLLAAACSKPSSDSAPPARSSASPAPLAATSTAATPAAAAGPMVAIPAGKLLAGTLCGEHPRVPAEELAEMILARYESKSAEGSTVVQPLVVRLCDRAIQLIAHLRAPVAEMEDPEVKEGAPGILTLKVKDGASSGEVKLTYQFAQVATEQPAWVKAGAAVSPAPSASAAAAVK